MANPVLAQAAAMLKRQGTGKDSMLIHVNPAEFKKVQKALGSKGGINPNTGLPAFDTGDGPGGDGGGNDGSGQGGGPGPGSDSSSGSSSAGSSASSGTGGSGSASSAAASDGPGLAGESTSGNPTGVDSYGVSDALGDVVSGNLTAAEALGFAFGGIMNSMSTPTGQQMGILGTVAPGKMAMDAALNAAVSISNAIGLSDARSGPGIAATGAGDAGGDPNNHPNASGDGKPKFAVNPRPLDNSKADADFEAAVAKNAIDPKATIGDLIDRGKLRLKLPFDLLSSHKLSFGSAGPGLAQNEALQKANVFQQQSASALGDFLAKINGGQA